MRSSAYLLLLSALWEAAACVNLRKIEFDILRSSRPSLFLFTATGCRECDRIQGLLDEAASGVLRTTPIATINCRDEPEACDESQIFAVPTLKFTSGNGDLVTYKEAAELPA
jgi:protein disulfide-isomerase A1